MVVDNSVQLNDITSDFIFPASTEDLPSKHGIASNETTLISESPSVIDDENIIISGQA